MNGFISKPVDPDTLYRQLLEWLPAHDGQPSAAAVMITTPVTAPAAQPSDSVLLAQLAGVPGLNVANGMAAVRNKPGKYLELLRHFVTEHVGDMDRLAETMVSGDAATAIRIAHSLKGAGATLGAERLAEIAKRVEMQLRGSADNLIPLSSLQADMDAIHQEFMVIAAVLPAAPKATAKPPTASNTPAPDPAVLQNLVSTLEVRLAEGEISAGTLFQENAVVLQAAFGEAFEALARQIRQFDFKSALETLRSLDRSR